MITYYYVTPKSFNEALKALLDLAGFTDSNPAIEHVENLASRTVALAERNNARHVHSHLVYVYPVGHKANDAMYNEADIVLVKDGPSYRIVKSVAQISDDLFTSVPPEIVAALEYAA
ncbi:hypothetical protein [Rhizobium phage RHEph12]|nr:hypothetical protein [Rhizobium phage RHEph12]